MSAPAAPPVRLGVIGCGRVFERFQLPAMARVPAVTLVAACDINRTRLSWAEQRTAPPQLFGTAAALLECAGLEAVLVLTPPLSHAPDVIQALEAGLHVLVEKPMALDSSDARQMVQAARQAQRHLQVGFTRRFREPYRALREALQQVDPERVLRMNFDLAFSTGSWNAESGFLGDESRGGGVLDDVLSHQVDLVCWMLSGRPDRVRCTVKDTHGAVRAELAFGKLIVSSDSAHGRYVERLEVEVSGGMIMEASGSRMAVIQSGFQQWRRPRARLLDRVALLGDRLLRRPNVSLMSFAAQLDDFVAAIRGGTFQGATGADGLLVVEVVQACRASARQEGAWQSLGTKARSAG